MVKCHPEVLLGKYGCVLCWLLGTVVILLLHTGSAQAQVADRSFDYPAQPQAESLELVSFLPLDASVVAVQGNYAYVAGGQELTVINISAPAAPKIIGRLSLPVGSHASSVTVSGSRVYVGLRYQGVLIVDMSSPASPKEVGRFTIPVSPDYDAYIFDIAADGNIIYVAADQGIGLRIFDVADPQAPDELGITNTYEVWDVDLIDNLAYIAEYGRGLVILDVSVPSAPREISALRVPESLHYDVAVSEGVAFISVATDFGGGDNGLWIVDVTNPSSPTEIEFFPKWSWFGPVAATDGVVYVSGESGESGLQVLDVSDPHVPSEIASNSEIDGDVVLSGDYIYVAGSYGASRGLSILRLLPSTVTGCLRDEWRVDYFTNRNLEGAPVEPGCEEEIDFYWGKGAPYAPYDGKPWDNWSARFSRMVDIPTTGWYHFRAFTDDGLRLYIDGNLVINDWTARDFAEQSTIQKLTQGPHQVTLEYVEWANDAMAHLTWYRTMACPDNAVSCAPTITPIYQTQYHSAMPAAWSDEMPKGCKTAPDITSTEDPDDLWVQTLAGLGCNVASLTMALQHYGVIESLTTVNDWLTKNDGYTESCTANLKSNTMITKFADSHGVSLTWNDLEAGDLAGAQRAVQSGHPVLLKVWGVETSKHFVLATEVVQVRDPATGQMQETLGINDPHHSWKSWASLEQVTPPRSILNYSTPPTVLEHATTLLEELDYIDGTTVIPIGYLTETVGARTASLQFNASNAEMLVQFDDGRRLGYDPATGTLIDEIKNAVYFDGEIVPPGGEPSGTLQRTLFIMEEAARSFVLRLFGPSGSGATVAAATPFEVTLVGLDAEYNLSEVTITGSLAASQVVEYAVDYSADGTLEVSPVDESADGADLYLPAVVRPKRQNGR